MTETTLLYWALLGFVPYKLTWRTRPQGRVKLHICALFWTLRVKRSRRRGTRIKVRILLIKELRDAVWAAIMKLQDG